MASEKQKKANIKKGLLGKYGLDVKPVVIQSNDVIRVEKELDNSREAKAKRKAVDDAKQTQQPVKKKK